MKAPYYIETLAPGGELLSRRQVPALPIRLGRGYDNDLILDDAYVGARHAVVEAYGEGHLMLRDLGSPNGSVHQGKRHSSIILGGDTVVRLGHTNLRVRGADHAVPPALADTTNHGWEGAKPALIGLGLVIALAIISNWLSDSQAFELNNYLLVIASFLGGALVWGAAWAVGNRLFGGQARFGRHLFILGCGLAAMELWEVFSNVAAFAWSLEWLTRYGNHALIAIACCMIFFHLSTVKPHHPRRFAVGSLVLLLLGSGLMLISNLQLYGRPSGEELYMSVLLPPSLRQSRDHTVDEFVAGAAKLKSGLDVQRSNPVEDSDDSEDDDDDGGGGGDDQ
ncbi:MAG TPA: FHA domain-containing protein [Janthinobacterium sp.]|jgi:pSer/pThr/pTyr-binding forkhead associated (FHA) protein|nr:FHA domain-containing protein [Janthinobacterium sp.]